MTKSAFKPKQILWVDLEMSGLNPNHDVILEVGAIATDWKFAELGVYEGVVAHDLVTLEEKLAGNAVFWDQFPEARGDLMEQNQRGKALEAVEDELLKFIDKHFDAEKPVLLGGNSIHMDRQFIDTYWPRLAARLHYRMLDVSAWKVVFNGKFGKQFAKPEQHRALGDIRGSIQELQYYLGKVRT